MIGRGNLTWTVTLLVMLLAASATAARWEVAGGGASEIVFTSKAPLESFKGRTHEVSGWVDFDPSDLAGALEFEVAVDLASFDTGKNKRNRHMRENHLETDVYPTAWFRGGAVAARGAAALAAGGEARVDLTGTLDLHGVQRDVTCAVHLQRVDEATVVVTATFEVKLSDHDIDRPKFLVMKLADEQQVEVKLTVRPGGAP